MGNRKFQLDLANNRVIFKPSQHNHFNIILPKLSKNQRKLLEQIEPLAKSKKIPITYELTNEHIFITFDEAYCATPYQNAKKDRVLAIDSNPNFLGITICDYNIEGEQKILHKEIISNVEINAMTYEGKGLSTTHQFKKYITRKRIYEGHEVAKYISILAQSWNCEYVALEDLHIQSKKKDKTQSKKQQSKDKSYRRKCNSMWNRDKMYKGVKKWCSLKSIKMREVPAQYSSFIGCINHSEDYDMIAASLEISRRANAFISTYITKIKDNTNRIVFPAIEKKKVLNEWKDEGLTAKDFSKWGDLYIWFKNKPKLNYRLLFTLEEAHKAELSGKSSRLFSHKSKLKSIRLNEIMTNSKKKKVFMDRTNIKIDDITRDTAIDIF
jgi:hypothetical protein